VGRYADVDRTTEGKYKEHVLSGALNFHYGGLTWTALHEAQRLISLPTSSLAALEQGGWHSKSGLGKFLKIVFLSVVLFDLWIRFGSTAR
jgi:hypothetical protein